MLLNRTRPQTTDFYWYDHRILKLGSVRDAYYGINRVGIDLFFYFNYIVGLPPGNSLEDALHMMEETSLAQFFFYKSRTKSAPNVPLQPWLAFLTIPSSTNLIHSRKALHTMLGYRRPPDHKCTRLPECWRVGITAGFPLVSYRFCITYSFIPCSLPRPPNSLSSRIHPLFSLGDRLIRYLGPGSIKPTQAPLR